MNELIEYVCEMLNIKTSSTFIVADIKKELSGIKNIERYVDFIKENINHIDLKFNTGIQKFTILTKRFKEIEFDESKPKTIESNAFVILKKLNAIRNIAKNEIEKGVHSPLKYIQKDGEKLFEKWELSVIKSIGSESYVIELLERDELEEVLKSIFLKKWKAKISPKNHKIEMSIKRF